MAEELSPAPTRVTPPSRVVQERRRRLILGGVVALVALILVVVIGGMILAYQHPVGASIARDLAIIFLALFSIVISIMVVLLLYQVTMLTVLLRDEIKPLLESMNETMNTVRGTAVFMSDNVVQPTIGVASAFAGVRRAIEALAGIRSRVKPRQRKE